MTRSAPIRYTPGLSVGRSPPTHGAPPRPNPETEHAQHQAQVLPPGAPRPLPPHRRRALLVLQVDGRLRRARLEPHRDRPRSGRAPGGGLRPHVAASAHPAGAQGPHRRLRPRGDGHPGGPVDGPRPRGHRHPPPSAPEARVPGGGRRRGGPPHRRRAPGLDRRAPRRLPSRPRGGLPPGLPEPRPPGRGGGEPTPRSSSSSSRHRVPDADIESLGDSIMLPGISIWPP